jgi:hypothetical protein
MSKQVGELAEGNFNGRTGTFVRKDNGDFSALESNCAGDLFRRFSLGDRINGNFKRIPSRRANLLHNTLVAIIEHVVRAESPDEIEIFGRGRCQDTESAHLCELDGVLTDR